MESEFNMDTYVQDINSVYLELLISYENEDSLNYPRLNKQYLEVLKEVLNAT